MRAGGGFAWFDLLKEPDEDDAAHAEDGEPAEDVDEGPLQRLATELLVELDLRGQLGVGCAEVAADGLLRSLQIVLIGCAGLGHVIG